MAQLIENFRSGTLDTLAGQTDTSLSSPGFANLGVVASPDTMKLVLDPDGVNGDPEIVTVTAHSSGGTTVTVTRGAEGTTARQHGSGTKWVLAATAADWGRLATAESDISQLQTDVTDASVITTGTLSIPRLEQVSFDSTLAANQQIFGNQVTSITWNNEQRDTHGFGNGTDTITIPTGQSGLYLATLMVQFTAGGWYSGAALYVDPSTLAAFSSPISTLSNTGVVSCLAWLNAGDTIKCNVYANAPQQSGYISSNSRFTLERLK